MSSNTPVASEEVEATPKWMPGLVRAGTVIALIAHPAQLYSIS